jgi:hypothetical protein
MDALKHGDSLRLSSQAALLPRLLSDACRVAASVLRHGGLACLAALGGNGFPTDHRALGRGHSFMRCSMLHTWGEATPVPN